MCKWCRLHQRIRTGCAASPARRHTRQVNRFAAMTRYVIDAPTLLQIVQNEIEVRPQHQLVAPNGIRSQALSLLLVAVQRGDLTEEDALRQHERFTELKIRLLGDRVSRRTAWKIAREQS